MHPDDVEGHREDYIAGMAGNNLAQLFVGLQSHKQGMEMTQRWAERANRIGWQNAGIDVAEIDKEAKQQLEDMDSSVRLSGDTVTNNYYGPKDAPAQPQPAPTPPPQPQPHPQRPGTKPNGTPTWVKWALAAAIGAAGAGPVVTTYVLKPSPPPDAGGSIFRFDTELPPWMNQQDQ